MTGPLSTTSPPQRSTSEPSTHQLIQAARCVMRRFEVQPENLQRALHMPYLTARCALDQLARWGIVTSARGAARRLVLVRPEHEQRVVQALTDHDGQPPEPNPLVELLTPAISEQLRRVHLAHLKGVLPTPVFQSGKDSR